MDGTLMPIPEVRILKLVAVCMHCGQDATRSHRIDQSQQRILIGDKEYEALCYSCYIKATA